MLRELTNNECKEFINGYYKKYIENKVLHDFMMNMLNDDFFEIYIFGKGKLWKLLEEKDIENLKFCTNEYCIFLVMTKIILN